ncbi:MAG: sulfite exporter TauE/SafE family protein [Actinomyces sp.]|nr:MAG: sulfite exporter TauE/SafE family protein [Actinomyces sp.]
MPAANRRVVDSRRGGGGRRSMGVAMLSAMRTRADDRPRPRHHRAPGAVLSWVLPGVATVVWALVVTTGHSWGRVTAHWASAVTMLGGSFLAGSSPEGGGAVAFPVFTKVLHVSPAVARTFGLSIQAVGMTMAVVAIVVNRRRLHLPTALVASLSAVVGFGLTLAVAGRHDLVFWPARFGVAWVKATFSVLLAGTSVLMIRHLRRGPHHHLDPPWGPRPALVVALVALAGGGLSALAGTGANIVVFLLLVVVFGVHPKVALPTAILVMAVVSLVGLGVLGVLDGQLDVVVAADRVVSVGGRPVELAASSADLWGLWMAAVPVVVWGAPLGSWAAARVREATLVGFVAVLAATEVVTTCILVPELRHDPRLIAYLVGGLVAVPALFVWAERRAEALVGRPAVPSLAGPGPPGLGAGDGEQG